jgi:hypothetical protein
MATDYTADQLRQQRRVAQSMLTNDESRLASLDAVPEDVRENHRRTINMRIAHYRERIGTLSARIEDMER